MPGENAVPERSTGQPNGLWSKGLVVVSAPACCSLLIVCALLGAAGRLAAAVWQPVGGAVCCLPPPSLGIFLGSRSARSMAQFGLC